MRLWSIYYSTMGLCISTLARQRTGHNRRGRRGGRLGAWPASTRVGPPLEVLVAHVLA